MFFSIRLAPKKPKQTEALIHTQIKTWIKSLTTPPSLVGIDITAKEIHLVELSCHNSSHTVESCASIPLDKPIADEMLRTKNIATPLSHTEVIFKTIAIEQRLTDKEIEEFLGLNTGSPYFDYQIIEKTTHHAKINAIVARRKSIEKHIQHVQAIGIKTQTIDADIYALERATRNQLKEISNLVATININHKSIVITMINHEKIVYADTKHINNKNACPDAQITVHIIAKLESACSSCKLQLEKIILSGETNLLPGLTKTISNHFNVKAIIANPFLNMQFSSPVLKQSAQKLAPQMAVACGLALRVTNDPWTSMLINCKEFFHRLVCQTTKILFHRGHSLFLLDPAGKAAGRQCFSSSWQPHKKPGPTT